METRDKDVALVKSFYDQVLARTTAPDMTERLMSMLAPGWDSIGDYTGVKKSREQFAAQLVGFGTLVPDLGWAIEELIAAGDRIIVRGRATGTPAGEFFGVPHTGRRFEVMSIDIHTVVDGRIARTYHIEDWAGAIKQLTAR